MKRRDLLKQAGGVLAASIVSPAAVHAAQEAAASANAGASAPPISHLMTTVSTYMSEAGARALPEAVVEKTKHMILDTLAAAISGAQLPPGKFAIQFARAYGGEKISTVAASTVVCGPIEAALANGMLAHSDETDDTHPPSQSHPGCSVVPSAGGRRENGTMACVMRAGGAGMTRVATATLGKTQHTAESHRARTRFQDVRLGRILRRAWPANALAAVLHGTAGLGPCVMAARHRTRREGVRLRRHAGQERRHGGAPGRGRRLRCGRRAVGRGQLLPGVRSEKRPLDARGQARRALRDHSHQRQEVDRGRADSGAARRAREPVEEAPVRGRSGETSSRPRCDQRSENRQQP